MTEQGQVDMMDDLFAQQEPDTSNVAVLIERMLDILNESGGWMHRRDFRGRGFTDRECRLAREHSKARIIFGQAGYKATSCATMDEIFACANTLESQGKRMLSEAQEYWKYYHKGGRA